METVLASDEQLSRISSDKKLGHRIALRFSNFGSHWSLPYSKCFPNRAERSLNGDGVIPSFDTKLAGRVSPLVCFDADFPNFVRQIGQASTDVTTPQTIVISANDWEEVSEQHMQMSAFRAVENGMWVVRSTSRGTSAVISPLGEVQGRISSFESSEPVMPGWISGGRIRTWYPIIGDAFAQASCIGLALLSLTAFIHSRRYRK